MCIYKLAQCIYSKQIVAMACVTNFIHIHIDKIIEFFNKILNQTYKFFALNVKKTRLKTPTTTTTKKKRNQNKICSNLNGNGNGNVKNVQVTKSKSWIITKPNDTPKRLLQNTQTHTIYSIHTAHSNRHRLWLHKIFERIVVKYVSGEYKINALWSRHIYIYIKYTWANITTTRKKTYQHQSHTYTHNREKERKHQKLNWYWVPHMCVLINILVSFVYHVWGLKAPCACVRVFMWYFVCVCMCVNVQVLYWCI